MVALPLAVGFAALAALATPAAALASDNHTCAVLPQYYSCELPSTEVHYDTCCTPVEGLVLVTQFWDTYTGLEAQGSVLPKDSWTIHGLWPDRCDGSYGQYCDLKRQYDPTPSPKTVTGLANGTVVPPWTGGDVITPILEKYGKFDLLAYINKYWKSQGSPDWTFWQHEFSKHATCFSTYDVGNDGTNDCYGPEYANATEASIIDFVESVARSQNKYPTWQWLAAADIKPSNKTGYPLAALQDTLTKASGAVPYLGCQGKTRQQLSEVWYYSHSLGRPQDVNYKPIDQVGKSNCNTTAPIWYYEPAAGSVEGGQPGSGGNGTAPGGGNGNPNNTCGA
ncbi:hypothetical protein Q8F55_002740 [Vanrija albida]|uniref:ribonuclease T2 n=1 Tax=Vanrija albida TaxID=181172 RepID=A0ABR3QAL6_9TREE